MQGRNCGLNSSDDTVWAVIKKRTALEKMPKVVIKYREEIIQWQMKFRVGKCER